MSVKKYGWVEFQKKIKDLSARDEGFLAIPATTRAAASPENNKAEEPKVKAEPEPELQQQRRSKRILRPGEENGEVEELDQEEEKAKANRQGVRGRRKKARRDDSQYATGRWLEEEHQLFLIGTLATCQLIVSSCKRFSGLKRYGRSWCLYKDLVKTRSAMQIRTHAQKFFKRIGGYIPGKYHGSRRESQARNLIEYSEVHGMSFSEEDIQKKIAKLVSIICSARCGLSLMMWYYRNAQLRRARKQALLRLLVQLEYQNA